MGVAFSSSKRYQFLHNTLSPDLFLRFNTLKDIAPDEAENRKAPAKRSQHANATYRNIVGRNMLRAFGHLVATCWVLLAQIWPVSNLSQQQPTCRNMSQQGGQTHSTCCAQQCCDMLCGMLRSFGRGFTCKRYACCLFIWNSKNIKQPADSWISVWQESKVEEDWEQVKEACNHR